MLIGEPGESYNVGNDMQEISMLELAEAVAKIIGNTKVEYAVSKDKNYLTDNPQRRCPVIDKARNQLHFSPEITISEGLQRIISWYRETYNLLK